MSVQYATTPRLYVDAPLISGVTLPLLPEASHYLCTVLRLGVNDHVRVFNGKDGEY